MTSSVVIRTDASREIGFGHFSRCASLASVFRSFGAEVTFAMRAPATGLAGRLSAEAIGFHEIDAGIVPGSDDDAAATAGLIERIGGNCVLVVDHYDIDHRWEGRLRPRVRKLTVIDDRADRRHDCDALIDQNRTFGGEEAYRGLVPDEALLLVGPRFALLRPEFAEWRAKPRDRDGTIRRLLVCFGGSDPGRHTEAALRSLTQFLDRLDRIDVIVGPLNPARAEIAAYAGVSDKIEVHVDAGNVAGLLHGADLAIGGGGVMSWERASLSVPTLAFGLVDNQFQNVRDLIRMGVALGEAEMTQPSEAVVARWLAIAMESPELVRGMAERAAVLVDGQGSRRVAARLMAGPLTFRLAGPDDSLMIHGWRNHPATRAVSGNSEKIPVEAHQRWFEASLRDGNRIILIAETDGGAVGVARFDLSDEIATISVFKDPASSAPIDIVGQASRWVFDNRRDLNQIRAVVLAANERSTRAFEAAGYALAERHYVLRRSERVATSDVSTIGGGK